MINKIAISNFRCYQNSEIEGFKKINLIGGLNNVGKTVLLEAILLNSAPTIDHILLLKSLRGEQDMEDLPEYTWDNFFHKSQDNHPIHVKANYLDTKQEVELIIEKNEEIDEFRNATEEKEIPSIYEDLMTNEKKIKSVLHLKYKIKEEVLPILVAIAHQKGISVKELNAPTFKTANFIPASHKRKQTILARDYGLAEKRNREKIILQALQIIDKDIQAIKVSVLGGAHLEIKKSNQGFMPVTLYGDAINKILNIILTLVNNNSSIILIDEIENGIHYTTQVEFWKFIHQLSTDSVLDFQLFATTHSLEMLKAFAKSLKEYGDDCAYVELYQNEDNIEATVHDLDTLNYELNHNMPVRGE